MRRTLRFVLPLAVFVSAVFVAAVAMAAPAAWERVDVTLHSEQNGGVLLVSGELPASVALPAQAELSVPAGAELQWIGQILGGEASADPELTYEKSTVGGSDVYRFTLTQSRIAQVEIVTNDVVAFDGQNYQSALKWTATQDIPEVRVAVRLPQGSQIVQAATGATTQPGEQGFSFYTKTVKDVKSGDLLDLAFSYKVAAVAPGTGVAPGSTAPASGSTSPVLFILAALAGAAGVGAFMAIRRKMAASWTSGSESQDVASSPARGQKKTAAGSKPSATTQAAVPSTGDSERRLSGSARRNLVTAGIIGGVLALALVFGAQSSKPQVVGDTIMRTFSGGEPCQTATIAVLAGKDVDPSKTADTLFAALEPVEGINNSTYRISASSLEVGYCESKTSDQAVRQALAPTGLVSAASAAPAASPATATTATAAPDGKSQALTVDTSTGSFSPTQLIAKAGTPVKINFGQGSGCVADVLFPELGISQNLEGGPVTVELPALKPGTYAFQCGHDMQRGALVVQ